MAAASSAHARGIPALTEQEREIVLRDRTEEEDSA